MGITTQTIDLTVGTAADIGAEYAAKAGVTLIGDVIIATYGSPDGQNLYDSTREESTKSVAYMLTLVMRTRLFYIGGLFTYQ